ncbi:hypothetical protein Tco_0722865 [Tanacetum coccineum]
MLGRESRTLTGNTPKHSRAHGMARSPLACLIQTKLYNRVQRSQNVSESEEEFEEGTKEEIKEEEEDSPEHFDTFPSMKELRLHYNGIMSKRLGPRRKPSNPRKICNFVGRVKGLKVLVGNFTYNCDFVVLEDTTSVIDHDLMLVVFGKSFVEATRLVYDREEVTITFEKDKEKSWDNTTTNRLFCHRKC